MRITKKSSQRVKIFTYAVTRTINNQQNMKPVAGKQASSAAAAATSVIVPSAEEIARVESFLRKHMFPETLDAFNEEKKRTFRRTSTITTATAAAAAANPPSPTSSDHVHDHNHANCCWTCIVCEKIFTKKGSAKRHCDTAHLEESAAERVECPQCLQKFNRRDDLYAHIRRIHHSTGGEELVQQLILASSMHRRQPKRPKKVAAAAAAAAVSLISHQEHLDVVLPSGNVICPPQHQHHQHQQQVVACAEHEHSHIHTTNNTCVNALAASAAVADDTHFRVLHDGHEDVIVNGTLQHYNDAAGVWENHGELASFEYDLDYLAGRYEDQHLWDEEINRLKHETAASSSSGEDTTMVLPQGSTLIKLRQPDCCPLHHACEGPPLATGGNPGSLPTHDSQAISHVLEAMRSSNSNAGATNDQ